MKKVVSLALSALLVLSLAACSSSNTTSTAASSAATSDAASSEESTSDSSTSTASSAADNATAEPDIQFDESFQPQTIADNDTCTIILQNVGYDDSYGYYWTVDFQNKTDDKTLFMHGGLANLFVQLRVAPQNRKNVLAAVNPPTTKVAGFPSFKERNLLTKWYSNPSASKSRRTNSPQES